MPGTLFYKNNLSNTELVFLLIKRYFGAIGSKVPGTLFLAHFLPPFQEIIDFLSGFVFKIGRFDLLTIEIAIKAR